MPITNLDNNAVCMQCGNTNLFILKIYPQYDVKIESRESIHVWLDDVEIEQELAELSDRQVDRDYSAWVCAVCGSEDIHKRYEPNPLFDSYNSPSIPAEDIMRATQYVKELMKER